MQSSGRCVPQVDFGCGVVCDVDVTHGPFPYVISKYAVPSRPPVEEPMSVQVIMLSAIVPVGYTSHPSSTKASVLVVVCNENDDTSLAKSAVVSNKLRSNEA